MGFITVENWRFSSPKRKAARAKLNLPGDFKVLTPRPFWVTVCTRAPTDWRYTAGRGLVTAPQQGRKGAMTRIILPYKITFA
jgi:hypothetical protein